MNLLHSATGWGMSGMRRTSSSVCVMVSAILSASLRYGVCDNERSAMFFYCPSLVIPSLYYVILRRNYARITAKRELQELRHHPMQ
jgi:hypothetical protein